VAILAAKAIASIIVYSYAAGRSATLEGVPNFTQSFCQCESSRVYLNSWPFFGSATGKRYFASFGGGIFLGLQTTDPNRFPGSLPGIISPAGVTGFYI
jgi:hypothetical protein